MNKTTYIIIGIVLFVLIVSKQMNKEGSESDENIEPMDLNNKQANIKTINDRMLAWGITSRAARIGILSVIGKESGFIPQWETTYKNTSNYRIRVIFETPTKGVSDAQLNELKKNDYNFFNFVYNGTNGNIAGTDDGYKYRGSGFNQLTGRGNYQDMENKTGIDLIDEPELNNTILVATETLLHYFQSRWNSDRGKAKLKTKNYNKINDINDVDFAVRYFCNLNAGLGRDLNGKVVNRAVELAKPYQKSLETIL